MKRDVELEKSVERELRLLVPQDALDCVEIHCGLDNHGRDLIMKAVALHGSVPIAVPPLHVCGARPSARQLSERVRLLALGLKAWAG